MLRFVVKLFGMEQSFRNVLVVRFVSPKTKVVGVESTERVGGCFDVTKVSVRCKNIS